MSNNEGSFSGRDMRDISYFDQNMFITKALMRMRLGIMQGDLCDVHKFIHSSAHRWHMIMGIPIHVFIWVRLASSIM